MANAQDSKNSNNNGASNAANIPTPPTPPTAGEIARAISQLVDQLERFPADAQRRVLEGAATALGIHRKQEQPRPAQRSSNGNRS